MFTRSTQSGVFLIRITMKAFKCVCFSHCTSPLWWRGRIPSLGPKNEHVTLAWPIIIPHPVSPGSWTRHEQARPIRLLQGGFFIWRPKKTDSHLALEPGTWKNRTWGQWWVRFFCQQYWTIMSILKMLAKKLRERNGIFLTWFLPTPSWTLPKWSPYNQFIFEVVQVGFWPLATKLCGIVRLSFALNRKE